MVFGFKFPYEELECAGLEWTGERGLIAREYTLKISGLYSNNTKHLLMLITRK